MKLTNEQREAVRSGSHTLLVACPGSGKTRTIVAKLLRCIEEVRDTARRVGCITYTNAAVDEIDERLRLYGGMDDEQYCEVSTIHTFCLNNILRCFYWRFKPYRNGFKILPSDSELYLQLAQETLDEHDISSVSVEAFENLNRLPDGTPISEELPAAAARTFWKKLQDRGLIDFTNIVYFSYRVLDYVPTVAHALACKFSWVLVDEFQDTSSLQTEILKRIADRGKTKFFLVGDPLQSIYSFAGARPELMDEFAVHLNAKTDCKLLGNFRSSTPIITHAERAIRRDPQMYACGDAVEFQEEPQYQPVSARFRPLQTTSFRRSIHWELIMANARYLLPAGSRCTGLGRC